MTSATTPAQASAPPHSLSAREVLEALESDAARGLSTEQAEERRKRYGPNELSEAPPVPWWKKLARQFRELVVGILIVAAVVSGLLGEWVDTGAILAIVLLNGLLGYLQEEKAEQALASLRKLSAPLAKVIRDGELRSIPARELVPGDRLELEAGDQLPADVRLLSAFGFSIQEAALTGESTPVEKKPDAVLSPATALADRRNMAYLGTVVASGKASAMVVSTGMATELGRIAGLLQRYQPEPTPLQRRLSELGRVLVGVCLGIVAVIFALQLLRGGDLLEVFLVSVSLAVAAVPEGMPAVVTVALALGLQRMVKRNALIRTLPSVETLGSVTVICTDKTGTLTRNEMTVRVVEAGGVQYEIEGVGYRPRGKFLKAGTPVDPRAEPDLLTALTIGAYCNNARLIAGSHEGDTTWQVIGDPTEGALRVAALKAGVEADYHTHRLVYEIPFDSERKAMSVVLREPAGSLVMYTKGAPEVVLSRSIAERRQGRVGPLREERRQEIQRASAELGSRALRVLALAYREIPREDHELYQEEELVFAGLVGMIDPPREEAKEAVNRCQKAGIRPVMITGDHPETALAIAREIGLARAGEGLAHGEKLEAMSDEDLAREVGAISVFARVSAEHKLRVVRAFKSRNEIVAMTGDGVNDAPAVRAADIGISMGLTGTDVTREASDMVLTDDNFASIVNAVEEGRGIFDNIQKFVLYLLTCNAGEVIFMFLASLVGWPTPLTAIQILWINLVTDGLPALALGMERPEPGIMNRPPRPPRERLITWTNGLRVLFYGGLVAAVTAFGFWSIHRANPGDLGPARTASFCIMAFSQLALAFGFRSQRFTLPELGPFSNPALLGAIAVSSLLQIGAVTVPVARPIFGMSGDLSGQWILLVILCLTPVTVIEVAKLVRKWVGSLG